jgi:glycerol-3-phosphate acyltransferase PlsY
VALESSHRIALQEYQRMSLPHDWVLLASLVTGAYLIGSIPFAVVISKLFGLADPRSYGSGNPGATNVLRSGNKAAALLTLIGDAAKGWFAVWLAAGWVQEPITLACVTLAVFLGHLFPLFLGFKGGKGVATAFGVLLAVQPIMALLTAIAWIGTAAIFRFSSLAAIVSAVLAPVIYIVAGQYIWQANLPMSLALSAMGVLLLYRHRANITRLLQGTEPRVGAKKDAK